MHGLRAVLVLGFKINIIVADKFLNELDIVLLVFSFIIILVIRRADFEVVVELLHGAGIVKVAPRVWRTENRLDLLLRPLAWDEWASWIIHWVLRRSKTTGIGKLDVLKRLR